MMKFLKRLFTREPAAPTWRVRRALPSSEDGCGCAKRRAARAARVAANAKLRKVADNDERMG